MTRRKRKKARHKRERRKREARPGAREKRKREARPGARERSAREPPEHEGGRGNQTRAADGAEKAQDKQPRALQTPYVPSRPILDRSLKEAIEGEVLSF